MTLAAAAVQKCLALGVREFAVCAGSRNSPVILQLAAVAGPLGLRLWRFFEERSAGFFALGRIRESGRPAAVLTTSGTAAAELLPSMIEAHYQGLPLIALTADRPRRFRGSGAPQAIDQVRLFGNYAAFVDAAEPADLETAGWENRPLHLNVCLEEPVPGAAWEPISFPPPAAAPPPPPPSAALGAFVEDPAGLLVVLGDLLPAERTLAREIIGALRGVAVWAEAASGLRGWLAQQDREGAVFLVRGGDSTLRHLPVSKVLRLGGVPSCRFWRDLEVRDEVAVLSVTRSGHSGLARCAAVLPWQACRPSPVACGELGERFRTLDRRQAAPDVLDAFPNSECSLLRHISRQIPPASGLFLGNSLAIREWNLVADPRAEEHCHVLRGANGIDGNLSFFLGCFADAAESWAVVGDLTALYDLPAPWILDQLPPASRRIVILNNGGGKIFSRLPSLRGLGEAERSLVENPHRIRFADWARMWSLPYVRVSSLSEWPARLPDGAVVIEVAPDAAQSEEFWSALAAREAEVWE